MVEGCGVGWVLWWGGDLCVWPLVHWRWCARQVESQWAGGGAESRIALTSGSQSGLGAGSWRWMPVVKFPAT